MNCAVCSKVLSPFEDWVVFHSDVVESACYCIKHYYDPVYNLLFEHENGGHPIFKHGRNSFHFKECQCVLWCKESLVNSLIEKVKSDLVIKDIIE